MCRLYLHLVLVGCVGGFPSCAAGQSIDAILSKTIHAYKFQPIAEVRTVSALTDQERLGQALFFDPYVSGPRNISCSSCHIRSLGSGDGLPLAVGLGANGVGRERLQSGQGFVIPRNALPLFNRGANDFSVFFWDGRVQLGPRVKYETPLGANLPSGFNSLLAAASIFPIVEPDEMLGRDLSRSTQATYHQELVTLADDDDNYQLRTLNALSNLMERLLGRSQSLPTPVVLRYRQLFNAAYPKIALKDFDASHVGNALAAYITAAFALQVAPWDRYVAGDLDALTEPQKHGAFLFYGKGRCAVCHSGRQFSDFRFHSLAIPQMRVGKHFRQIDYGRAATTSRGEHRFQFRTPPLRNVLVTGPWGHNGIFTKLPDAISHHLNPIPLLFQAQQEDTLEGAHAGRLLGFRSDILPEISPLSHEEIDLLADFLGALSSRTVMPDDVALPQAVPSGDNRFIRR